MQVAPTIPGVPRPLPGGPAPRPQPRPGGGPAAWSGLRLATITAVDRSNGRSFGVDAFAGESIRGIDQFVRLEASSLDDAVRGAARISRGVVGRMLREGPHRAAFAAAVGVLRAGDGSFFATVLSDRPGRRDNYLVATDSAGRADLRDAVAHTPDLLAIVGESRYVDFSDPVPGVVDRPVPA